MNKKTIAGVFAALFLLLSLLPAAGMLLSRQSVAAANETLSTPPKLRRCHRIVRRAGPARLGRLALLCIDAR